MQRIKKSSRQSLQFITFEAVNNQITITTKTRYLYQPVFN